MNQNGQSLKVLHMENYFLYIKFFRFIELAVK